MRVWLPPDPQRLADGCRNAANRLVSFARKHPTKATIVAVILLAMALWFRAYAGRDVVLPFAVGPGWQDEHGQSPELELAASLASSSHREPLLLREDLTFPFRRLESLRDASYKGDKNKSKDKDENDKRACEQLLQDPAIAFAGHYVFSFGDGSRSGGSGATSSGGSFGAIKTPLGAIPLDFFNNVLLSHLPVASRVYDGTAIATTDSLRIGVRRVRPRPAKAERVHWWASGPKTGRAEIFEYLSVRLQTNFAGVGDRDLALALAVEALERGQRQRTLNFLAIARSFAPHDSEVETLIGLTTYSLARDDSPSAPDPGALDAAIHALRRAVNAPGPNAHGETTRPYLHCLLLVSGQKDTDLYREGEKQHETWRERLEDPARTVERSRLLASYPLPGPSRQLATAGAGILMGTDDGRIFRVAKKQNEDGSIFFETVQTADLCHRQILEVSEDNQSSKESAQGELVVRSKHGRLILPSQLDHKKGESVKEAFASVVHQMSPTEDRSRVYVLGRSGMLFARDTETRETVLLRADPPSHAPTRQVLAAGNKLFLLAGDGSVWLASSDGKLKGRVMPPAPVREIAAGKIGSELLLFALHQNGNVWACRQANKPGTAPPFLFDSGTSTQQIFPSDNHLYVLKTNGQIWRRAFVDGAWKRVWRPNNGWSQFREILVVRTGVGARSVFVKSANDRLFHGEDHHGFPGDRLTLKQIFSPPIRVPQGRCQPTAT